MRNKYITEQAIKEWGSILTDKMPNLKENVDRYKWMCEYAYNHARAEQYNNSSSLNEAYGYSSTASLGNTPGMGSVSPGAAPGGPYAFYGGKTGSGDKFPTTLPIAIQIANRTVGFDIVNVIPMQGPTGVLAYIDYVYGGGKVGSESQPASIKIAAGKINSTDYVVGQTYWGISDKTAPTGTKAVEMQFVGYSFYDGAPIFRIGGTYTITNSTGTLTITSDETIAISMIFDGESAITVNNNGVPKIAAATDYVETLAKPELVKALEDHIQGYAGSGTYDQDPWSGPAINGLVPSNPMSRATGENTYYRVMNMQTFSKIIQAETFKIAITLTTEQIQDLDRQWGLDVISMAENTLVNEVSQSINKHILSRAFALGWSNNADIYRNYKFTANFTTDKDKDINNLPSNGRYINKLGFVEEIPVPPFQDFGAYENISTIQRRLKSKVLVAGNLVHQRSKRGPANFVVTNLTIASALQDIAQYNLAPMANTINQQNGSLYPLGAVAGMTIYVDPNMGPNDNRILVGRKGSEEEPGLKMMPYLMAETIQTIAEGTMAPKLAVVSRYALVEAGHQPQSMYYTIHCDFGAAGII